jgi:hypothetical protein
MDFRVFDAFDVYTIDLLVEIKIDVWTKETVIKILVYLVRRLQVAVKDSVFHVE